MLRYVRRRTVMLRYVRRRTVMSGHQLLPHLEGLLLRDMLDVGQVVHDLKHGAVQHRVGQAREQLQGQPLLEPAGKHGSSPSDAARTGCNTITNRQMLIQQAVTRELTVRYC